MIGAGNVYLCNGVLFCFELCVCVCERDRERERVGCGGVVIIDSKRENYSSMLDFRLSLLIGKTLYI